MQKTLVIGLIALLLLSACGPRETEPRFVNIRGIVFGTYYSISYYHQDGTVFQTEIDSLLEDFNQSLSYYQPNSVISRINRNETDVVDEYFREVFLRSQEISEATQGAFDATVTPLVNAWGFGFQERAVITQGKIDSILDFVGYEKVSLVGDRIIKEDERIQFDFNAIAKGYASDVVGAFLEAQGIDVYMVEIGGDLTARGKKPDGSKWRIGLEKPAKHYDDPQDWEFYVELHDRAVATSGSYRRYYEEGGQRYSHTIDPSTGYPVDHNLLSVSVFAPDAMTADAYATAFMVMGFEKAREFVEAKPLLDAYFIFSESADDYGTYATGGLNLLSREDL
jgi:FAD:protein FMN transferase